PEKAAAERANLVAKARRSGFKNLPDVVAGPTLSLASRRPASAKIEDTEPVGSDGTDLIVREAHKASAEKPLVILMGGNATAVADAYLSDPSIADRIVPVWIGGQRPRREGDCVGQDYNTLVDAWAAYILQERLRTVLFPFRMGDSANGWPAVPRKRLLELPDTELRQNMIDSWWDERDPDPDSVVAFSLTRPEHVLETRRLSFSHWKEMSYNWAGPKVDIQAPFYKPGPEGKLLAVWRADPEVATDEFWKRLTDPAAWGTPQGRVPFGGSPWKVPGKIEAHHFDEGGPGRAYWVRGNKYRWGHWHNDARLLESVNVVASETASGGYKVSGLTAGEWIEYALEVRETGDYAVEVQVASNGPGGAFHLEFDGVEKTGSVKVPNTGGWDQWRTCSIPGIRLDAGTQVMRIAFDSVGKEGVVGDFDFFRITG
ncbi:MAG: carbohydrate-binding protein, partial [Kiritimatiellae bacterium]|nr:carbohydrate-binding protein [Kiritimatiellia bacterium]